MTTFYCRPTRRMALSVEPRLASWDVAGSPGQVRLGNFLDHAEAVAAPMIAAVDGLLAVELIVGLRGELALTGGGRDLDNYLFPLAQRLGPTRIGPCSAARFTNHPFWLLVRLNPTAPRHPRSSPLRSPVPISVRNGRQPFANGSSKSNMASCQREPSA